MGKAMRFYKLLLIVALVLPNLLWSGPRPREGIPFQDGILTLSDRHFIVSDLARPVEKDDWRFSLRQSAWLAPILNEDPILQSWQVELIWAGVHGTQLLDSEEEVSQKPLATLVTDSADQIEGYTYYNLNQRHFYFFPKSSNLNYSVSCGNEPGSNELNICHIHALYPYDAYVVLRAMKFFPGKLSDVPLEFESIAARMVEIAVCLDVTDQSNTERDLFLRQPDAVELTGCELTLGS
jgi:hypothetical protein